MSGYASGRGEKNSNGLEICQLIEIRKSIRTKRSIYQLLSHKDQKLKFLWEPLERAIFSRFFVAFNPLRSTSGPRKLKNRSSVIIISQLDSSKVKKQSRSIQDDVTTIREDIYFFKNSNIREVKTIWYCDVFFSWLMRSMRNCRG